jgi:AraC-like DNA-binding protein
VLWIVFSVVIYLLGHLGIYKFGINEERKKIRTYAIENKKYSEDKKSKNQYIQALENLLINEKQFLDANLTLESVAKELGISTSYLSRIINAELKMSFTEYLNKLRIEQAKLYLNNPSFSNYTILAIGMEAGFNSKSSFFNVFKKITGSTPLAYKNAQFDK